jgi:hypothetical protein
VVRQGSAKSSSGVQIPSTPLQKQTKFGLLFCLCIIMKNHKKDYNQLRERS